MVRFGLGLGPARVNLTLTLTLLPPQENRQIKARMTTPSSLEGEYEYRAVGRARTPSRVAPPVGRHQLPQRSSTHLLKE